MTYLEQIPIQQLNRYVQKFWYCQAENFSNTTITIPLLHHELVFNFSEEYHIKQHLKGDDLLNNTITWVSGIQEKPTLSFSSGKHEMIGALFKADGLNAFTKFSSNDFTNCYIDASLIFNNSFACLIDEIQNTHGALSKIQAIESYLLRNLKTSDYPDYLAVSLKLFSSFSDEKISIKEGCYKIGISNKSLIKSYQKFIGVNPSKFLQLQSINKAIALLPKIRNNH
jgi:hypothetical protein